VSAAAQTLRQAQAEQRVGALLELRGSLNAAASELEAANARRAAAQSRRAAAHAAEYDRLLSSGLNPHVEWRRAEMDAKVAAEAARHVAAVEASRLEVTRAVVSEAKRERAVAASNAAAEAAAAAYRRGQSKPVRDAAAAAFLISNTLAQADLLQERKAFYPSDVAATVHRRLGTGALASTRPDLLDFAASQPFATGAQPLAVAVPRRLPDPDAAAHDMVDDDDMMMSAPPGGLHDAQQQHSAPEEGGGGAETTKPAVAFVSGQQRSQTGAGKRIELRQPTKAEQALAARALARQRATLAGVPQSVMGKEYSGPGFAAEPSVLVFRDVSPAPAALAAVQPSAGAVTLEFQLTNISLTFNNCLPLPMSDAVRDLFTVAFVPAPPGRLSAGTSVRLRVVYLPKQVGRR
jgi:hypothetical protein